MALFREQHERGSIRRATRTQPGCVELERSNESRLAPEHCERRLAYTNDRRWQPQVCLRRNDRQYQARFLIPSRWQATARPLMPESSASPTLQYPSVTCVVTLDQEIWPYINILSHHVTSSLIFSLSQPV